MKRKLFIIIAVAFWEASVCISGEMGELHLEGEHIERLVLQCKDRSTQEFNHPGKAIRLPVGEYRLHDVRLKGGYNYNRSRTTTYHWVTVTENKPAVFKVGTPLKQTVKIERQGPILILNYELTGTGGETYNSDRDKRPMFTVFKGDKKIGTGEFEFG